MKQKPTINPNDLMLVSRTHYNDLLIELDNYKKFFKNFQKLLDKQ